MIKLINKYKIILIIIGIVLINLGILWYESIKKEEAILIIEEPTYAEQVSPVEEQVIQKSQEVPLYICGEVNNPGVYFLPKDALLQAVVEGAGGFTVEADKTFLNLARQVVPNEKIYVPKIGEKIDKLPYPYDNSSNGQTVGVVNINRATLEELKNLPGIGEVKAQQIIDYRTNQGLFKAKEEIQNVQGIGEKTYQHIEQMITTE